jgi:multiple sugar transport system substrate-binding protein
MDPTARMRGGRRSTAVLAILLLVVGGCTGTPDGDVAPTDDGAAPTDDGAAPPGATVVTFWQTQFNEDENEWWAGLVDAFNEAQDEVVVRHSVVPGDAWDQRMTAAQAAGNAPDIYTMNYGLISNAARTGQIQSLASAISAEAWDDLDENVREMVSVDGEEYAYPLLVEPSAVLYYRRDLFAEAGIEGPPTTWDELIEYAERLSTDEVFGMRLAQDATAMSWSTWGYQWNVAGRLPISEDWCEPRADEAYAPLLQAFQDLFASGALPPADGATYPDARTYGEGKYAMMANGSWAALQLLSDYPEIAEQTEVAAMPSFDGQSGQTTATLGGWTLVADGGSERLEEAAAFIEWALGGDPENVIPFFEVSAFSKVSPRTSVAERIAEIPDIDEVNPWNVTVQEDVVPFAQAEPTYPFNVSLAMGEAIELAMQGTPVDEALADANANIEREIEASELCGTGPGA